MMPPPLKFWFTLRGGALFPVLRYKYKLCYEKCKTCEMKGDDTNNNCIECNTDYPFGILKNDYLNFY